MTRQDGRDRRWAIAAFVALALFVVLLVVRASPAPGDDVVASAVLLVVGGLVLSLWPSLDYQLTQQPMAPLIAFVGCDGSGKSTLTGDMARHWSAALPVRTCYLGSGSAALGERIKRWPLVGASVERHLARKAAQTRTSGNKIPGLATAAVVYFFSLLRLRRFKRMLRLRRAGVVVLTDRYPQIEVPGCYDGPGLSAARAESWLVALLVERERRIYRWMTAFNPDVVVRLNVDAATALARKPDHRPDLVARKVAITPQLRFAGARIVDLDACQPYATVRQLATAVVQDTVAAPRRFAAAA